MFGFAYLTNVARIDFAGKTINLKNDINMSAREWMPISTFSACRFEGIFDGEGNTIIINCDMPK